MSNPQPASEFPAISLSPNQKAWARFRTHRPAVWSTRFLALLLMLVVLWPIGLHILPKLNSSGARLAQQWDPEQTSDAQFQPPSLTHWFGTDVHGRDVFSRVVFGAQISLLVGLVGAGVSLVIGVCWGAAAGYFGGRLDSILMRIVDILYSLPSIIFVIVLITTLEGVVKDSLAMLGSEWVNRFGRLLLLFAGLGSVSWLTMARIVRGQVLSLRHRAFVEASRTLGAGPVWVLSRHIVPNIMGVVIVYLTLTIPAVVLYESFLSYLGLGIQPPMASWGTLIAEGADQINPIRIYWWLILFPASVLVVTLLALNFVGDGLRDAWDIRRSGPKAQ
jgi:peptide/nickel transport system permease protein/oligopeptide transport system permease protein